MTMVRRIAFMLGCAVSACGGDQGPPDRGTGGTLIISTGGDADALLPPLVQTITGKAATDLLFMALATPSDSLHVVGGNGDYSPSLAERWEWSTDSLSIVFHLRPGARWHDQAPVVAEDVRFTMAAYQSPAIGSAAASHLANVDSIVATSATSFVVWFRQRSPTQFHDFVYNFRPIPRHIYAAIPFDSLATSPLARQPVGSGKFRFARWEPNVRLELIADTAHWIGRPLLDRVIWTVGSDPDAAVGQLSAAEVDLIEYLRASQLERLAGDTLVRIVGRKALDYATAVFNTRSRGDSTRPHPLFHDVATRRALSMAVDCRTLVSNVLDSLGRVMDSPFLAFQRISGVTLLPFDATRAARMLDSLGWTDTNGDGFRERRGVPLSFRIMAPNSSPPRVNAAVLLVDQFRKIGAKAEVERVDFATSRSMIFGGDFDIAVLGFIGDPTPNFLRQTFAASEAPQNFGKYANPRFEATLDSADHVASLDAAGSLFARAGQILADDAPMIWLYELSALTGYHRRLRPAPMRADAWWAHLDEWSVDPDGMIDRDRIGVRAPTP
jgi:peptide/nickel transport system substrate-binding protein